MPDTRTFCPVQYALAWHRIRQMSQEDIKVEGEILGANRGGLIVSVGHIRGFMPGSHLASVRRVAPCIPHEEGRRASLRAQCAGEW